MKTFIPVYQCPTAPQNILVPCCGSIPGNEDAAETNYSAVATHRNGTDAYYARDPAGTGVMHLCSATRLAQIVDGTSNTFSSFPSSAWERAYPTLRVAAVAGRTGLEVRRIPRRWA